MNDGYVAESGRPGSDGERTTLIIAYILDVLAPFTSGLLAIISVIISHIKVGETNSEFIRSHHRWLIRTFWWGLLWGMIFGILAYLFIGIPLLIALAVWWWYRIIRGLINYSNGSSMPG